MTLGTSHHTASGLRLKHANEFTGGQSNERHSKMYFVVMGNMFNANVGGFGLGMRVAYVSAVGDQKCTGVLI